MLTKKDLAELKAYAKPPALVEFTLNGVMTVLKRPATWDEAKKALGDASFMSRWGGGGGGRCCRVCRFRADQHRMAPAGAGPHPARRCLTYGCCCPHLCGVMHTTEVRRLV